MPADQPFEIAGIRPIHFTIPEAARVSVSHSIRLPSDNVGASGSAASSGVIGTSKF